ncbi:MAG: hypothetical protein MJY85_09655 [Fibrobacter sp.]|nr:hypothetical protein [Fibrobacter sp.]
MNEFESALQGLLNFDASTGDAAARYNALFKQMVTASMQICGETDFDALVNQKIQAVEAKYGAKIEFSEEATDVYKKLREVVRFELARESILANMDYEVCCTQSNLANAMGKIRGELDKIVPENQKEVVESIGYSLYSDFTKFFVCSVFDMIADSRIYNMPEFRPLQLNAMGKEVRTNVNVIHQQNSKPQKSEVVTNWFNLMMILPSFLFKKLYGVSLTEMFEVPQKVVDDAAHMYNIFVRSNESFMPGDEYKILLHLLAEMGLSECFTVRPKVNKPASKTTVN